MDVGFYIGTIIGPTEVLIWDPCPVGSPEILTVAHMAAYAALAPDSGLIPAMLPYIKTSRLHSGYMYILIFTV